MKRYVLWIRKKKKSLPTGKRGLVSRVTSEEGSRKLLEVIKATQAVN